MERRRLAVLCSHLRQIDLDRPISPQRLRSNVVSHAPTSSCSNSAEESKKGNEEKDCIFCMIIRGESPAYKLYEDDLWVCILDSNPLSHGHSLVIPKSHYSSLGVTPPSVVAAMFYKVPFLSKAIMKATHCDSFNLLVNNGAAAGQVIFHTHLHIIPRKACDRLWTHQSFRRKPLKPGQDTARIADCIRECLLLPANSSESFQGQKSKLDENS
ncbi:hypothetical protein AAC387_Pa02g0213 [Persea americana]|eukprot:TRINITY_DN4853_c1_g2_i3.p1 TRINITY_DN4853_c1_g2~~TRINITY_DN4853_c1_g2_i3.p1  ORF type:complete len:213 (-),score=21.21 TRINITY_DN4853_c1_g2_i3:307-945(-)